VGWRGGGACLAGGVRRVSEPQGTALNGVDYVVGGAEIQAKPIVDKPAPVASIGVKQDNSSWRDPLLPLQTDRIPAISHTTPRASGCT